MCTNYVSKEVICHMAFYRTFWVLAASFYIKNLCHHSSQYLVCQSWNHLSPHEGY